MLETLEVLESSPNAKKQSKKQCNRASGSGHGGGDGDVGGGGDLAKQQSEKQCNRAKGGGSGGGGGELGQLQSGLGQLHSGPQSGL